MSKTAASESLHSLCFALVVALTEIEPLLFRFIVRFFFPKPRGLLCTRVQRVMSYIFLVPLHWKNVVVDLWLPSTAMDWYLNSDFLVFPLKVLLYYIHTVFLILNSSHFCALTHRAHLYTIIYIRGNSGVQCLTQVHFSTQTWGDRGSNHCCPLAGCVNEHKQFLLYMKTTFPHPRWSNSLYSWQCFWLFCFQNFWQGDHAYTIYS